MMIMCLSVLPSFASADTERVDITSEILGLNRGYQSLLDSNKDTMFRNVPPNITLDLGKERYLVGHKFNLIPSGAAGNVKIEFLDSNSSVIQTRKYQFEDNYFLLDVRYLRIVNESRNSDLAYIDLNVFEMKDGIFDVSNLSAIPSENEVAFTWSNPFSKSFTGVRILKEGKIIADVDKNVNFYKVQGLESNTNYNFEFVALYGENKSRGVQKGVKTLIDLKKVPPGPVSSLTAEPTDKTVKLKWKKPNDDDLVGFKILQNGKEIAGIGLEEEFTVKNLQSLTDYTFSVISVDKDKNDSSPVSLSVKTLFEKDEEPPHVPTNVFAKPSNGALIASWDKVSDKDLAGYNLYVDGKKINSNLITSTNFVIKNLENSKKYKVQVQAVDRSGNASELSLAAFGTPDVNTIPVIESNYGVKDVSDGVGTMFSQIWPALAFSVGIVLAFYVIYKLKHTILP